jgi:outer membrane biosynthesis protein TonB
MRYALFADCINETLLLGDISLGWTETKEERDQNPGNIYAGTFSTTNKAVTSEQQYGVGVIIGQEKTEKEEPFTPEEPEDDPDVTTDPDEIKDPDTTPEETPDPKTTPKEEGKPNTSDEGKGETNKS